MTPMQEHLVAHPVPNPEDKHAVIGYLIEPEQLVYLTIICKQLQGGTDRERDYGHRLWLIINKMRDLPVTQGDMAPAKPEPKVYRTYCALRSCGAEYLEVEGQHARCPECGNN